MQLRTQRCIYCVWNELTTSRVAFDSSIESRLAYPLRRYCHGKEPLLSQHLFVSDFHLQWHRTDDANQHCTLPCLRAAREQLTIASCGELRLATLSDKRQVVRDGSARDRASHRRESHHQMASGPVPVLLIVRHRFVARLSLVSTRSLVLSYLVELLQSTHEAAASMPLHRS